MHYIVIALIFNIIDCISGLLAGYKKDGKLISSKLRTGLFKKSGFVLCYILSYFLNIAQQKLDLDINVNMLPVVCVYVIFTEIVSIIENISYLNDKILPEKIKKIIGIGGNKSDGN